MNYLLMRECQGKIYDNMPESTDKIMFEGANDGHGFAAYPYGEVQEYALNWMKYQVLGR